MEPPARSRSKATKDRLFFVATSWIEHQACRTGVDYDRDRIIFPQLLRQQLHAFDHQRQLVRAAHGPGDVQQKDQVAGRTFVLDHFTLDRHACEPVFCVPGALRHGDLGSERMLVCFRRPVRSRK